MIRPVEWRNGAVVLLDQRLLPMQEVYRVYRDHREVARAIKDMVVRGAPAIGVAAAMGIALGMAQTSGRRPGARLRPHLPTLRRDAADGGESLLGDRAHAPRLRARARPQPPRSCARCCARRRSRSITRTSPATARSASTAPRCSSRARRCSRTATRARSPPPATARRSASIRAAHEAGKQISVIATETRPFLQGARLTAWELKKDHIPVTLITDNMVGHFMQRGAIGARDRRRRPRRPPTATSPTRSAPTRVAVLARAPPHPVLRRGADLDDRSRLPERRRDPDRGARRARGDAHRSTARSRRRGVKVAEPGLRRHAARAGHRDHHRARRGAGAVREVAGAPSAGGEPRDVRRRASRCA